MYWTPEGARILSGAEATVFVAALAIMVDLLTDEDVEFGVLALDRLQRGQKLVVLEQVAAALLSEATPMPKLSAVIEAAVAAVYRFLEEMICQECDELAAAPLDSERPSWRQRALAACRETGLDDELPEAESTDVDEWSLVIAGLADRVLWDTDFEAEDEHLDADPETSRCVKALMGIHEDYFLAVPLDPLEAEIPGLIARLRHWTQAAR